MTMTRVANDERPTGQIKRDKPLRADAERNRLRLLTAAQEVFADRGLDVTLDDIAAHAGLGVGTAYRRFANKEALIESLFEVQMEGIVDIAQLALAVPDPWSGLVQFLEHTCALLSADKGIRQVFFRTRPAESRVSRSRDRLLPLTTLLVAHAKASGQLRADFDPLDLPIMILMVESVTDFTDTLHVDVSRRCLSLVLDGLRAERVPPSTLAGRPLTPAELESAMTNRRGT